MQLSRRVLRRHRLFGLAAVSLIVTIVAVAAAAQLRVRPEDVVTLKVHPPRLEVAPGESFSLALVAEIRDGYHINSTKPLEKYLIPAEVDVQSDDFELVETAFPEGELKSFSFSEEKLSVYEGTLRTRLVLKSKDGVGTGDYTLGLRFHYQACNDRICLRPTKKEIAISVKLR